MKTILSIIIGIIIFAIVVFVMGLLLYVIGWFAFFIDKNRENNLYECMERGFHILDICFFIFIPMAFIYRLIMIIHEYINL